MSILDGSNPSKPTPIDEVKLHQIPIDVAVSVQTNRVFVSNPFQHRIHVLDGDTGIPLTPIDIGPGLLGLTVDQPTGELFVARSHGTGNQFIAGVHRIRFLTDGTPEISPLIAIGSPNLRPIDVAVGGDQIHVACFGGGAPPNHERASVVILDRATHTPTKTVATIANPHAVAFDAGRNQVLIGTDAGLQILDAASGLTAVTLAKNAPRGIALDPAAGRVYAGSATEGTVTSMVLPDLGPKTTWTPQLVPATA